MKKRIIGLMSGTSLDGLDICLVEFDLKNLSNYKILQAETIEYPSLWKERIANVYNQSALDLVKLDKDLGIYFGNLTKQFIEKNQLENIDLVASHGQTIFHNPSLGYTTQIGHPAYINVITQIKTIGNFRYQDVALGGEGAPLVPIGDKILFEEYKYCLNLGGFANISIKEDKQIKAFDICPANIVLNYYAQKVKKPYDKGGEMASKGRFHPGLFQALNDIEEYKSHQPKSLGWELVEEKIIPLIDSFSLSVNDVLSTYVEHIAFQIAQKIEGNKMIVTGGGVYNQFLIDKIKKLSSSKIIIPSNQLINFKEALIFAFLGLLKEEGKINVLSSVTGAKKDHSSGLVYDAFATIN